MTFMNPFCRPVRCILGLLNRLPGDTTDLFGIPGDFVCCGAHLFG